MSLFDHPDFREWFRATHRKELGLHPELSLGECESCGSSGVAILVDNCLVCVASDFGMSLGERRIADALRAFIRVSVNEPPEAGYRLVSQMIFTLAEATRDIADDGGSDDEPEDDKRAT